MVSPFYFALELALFPSHKSSISEDESGYLNHFNIQDTCHIVSSIDNAVVSGCTEDYTRANQGNVVFIVKQIPVNIYVMLK